MSGLNAHFAAKRVDDARAVGANEAGFGLAAESVRDLTIGISKDVKAGTVLIASCLNLVSLRDTLSDADNEANLILNGLNDSVGGERRGNIENGSIRLGFLNRLKELFQLM
jgi:hypothetical protein